MQVMCLQYDWSREIKWVKGRYTVHIKTVTLFEDSLSNSLPG